MIDIAHISQQAAAELQEEQFRIAVETEKERLRNKKALSFWKKLFSFKIKLTIERR